jgi:hypothetical protein
VNRTILVNDREDNEHEVEVEIQLCRDYNYGADADGNRGIMLDEIYDVIYNEKYDFLEEEIAEAVGKLDDLSYDSADRDAREAYEEMMFEMREEES